MGLNLDNVRCSGIPSDRLIEHGPRPGQLAEIGLDATGIAATFEEIILATPTRRTRVRRTRTSQKKRGQVLG